MNLFLLVAFILMTTGATHGQKVYSVDYPNQAGWRKASKKHLMY